MHIVLTADFKKQLIKHTAGERRRFYERLHLFKENKRHPLLQNHALVADWDGYRSINIGGDLRAVYYEEKGVVIFVAIGTHSALYKK